MKIDHGGFKVGVAHVPLNDSGIDACFQEMGCIAVAHGMDRNSAFGNACSVFGLSEGALDAGDGHRFIGGGTFVSASAKSRENQDLISVGNPVASQQLIGVIG
jgi:hypothetical protein